MTIETVIQLARKHAKVTFPSVIIAQALLESGLMSAQGASGLALKYHNWFGIKGSYQGRTTPELETNELVEGKWVKVSAGFRWYENSEQSFEDHERLLSSEWARNVYQRFRSAASPEEQAKGLEGVYATDVLSEASIGYCQKLVNYIKEYDLKQYDEGFKLGVGLSGVSAEALLDEARKLLGIRQYGTEHKRLVDDYNAVKPLPEGYRVTYDDSWCDVFVTVMADRVGGADLIGRECGVQRHYELFKLLKIWLGNQRPLVGDIVVFDFDGFGFADHIGLVESVNGEKITTIEGNTQSVVGRRTYVWNDWRIKGYARPRYGSPNQQLSLKSLDEIANEVLKGMWGDGKERVEGLKATGYDAVKVQNRVNELLAKPPASEKVKRVKVSEDATRWLTGEPISPWVHGKSFEVKETKVVQPHQSLEAYLLVLDGVTLGWLLEEDVVE